jgi:hypothetical protein
VTIQKAQNVLSFHPQDNVASVVANLLENQSKFQDWDNPFYYNIQQFKRLEAEAAVPQRLMAVGSE